MTRVQGGDRKAIGMVKVDKLSGKETGKIVVNVLDTIYEMDQLSGQLFVVANEKLATTSNFSCFKFID